MAGNFKIYSNVFLGDNRRRKNILLKRLFYSIYPVLFFMLFFSSYALIASIIIVSLAIFEILYSYYRGYYLTIVYLLGIITYAFLSFIPYVGVVFVILGLLFSILRIVFVNSFMINSGDFFRYYNEGNGGKRNTYEEKNMKNKGRVYDVEFKEKR